MIPILLTVWLVGWVLTLWWLDSTVDYFSGLKWFAGPILLVIWPIQAIGLLIYFILDNWPTKGP